MKLVNSSTSSSKQKNHWSTKLGVTTLFVIFWILLADIIVQATLTLGNRALGGKLNSLVTYFDYGRSVPGKLKIQFATDAPPVKAAWRDEILAQSAEQFSQDKEPSYRFYGMSFSNQIATEWRALDPSIRIDEMNGPGAAPNATFDWAIADRANRREGDVVVWTILSSSLSGMASLSRQTWSFEQPTPYTAPVYMLTDGVLIAERPIIDTYEKAKQSQGAEANSELASNWQQQLKKNDLNYSPAAYILPQLDFLPSARLIRRAIATSDIRRRRKAMLGIDRREPLYPYAAILKAMALEIAKQTYEDDQEFLVLLVQTQERGPDLQAELGDWLASQNIDYFATASVASPNEPANYIADGHFRTHVSKSFAEALAVKFAVP